MSAVLPTNRDENWRYANLRPLAKASMDAVTAGTLPGSFTLPAPTPGHERWVFRDGHFDTALSTRSADSPAALLDSRAAGTAFAAMLDEDLARAGVDFALARMNASRGEQVLHIRLADHAPRFGIELWFIASATGDTPAQAFRASLAHVIRLEGVQ